MRKAERQISNHLPNAGLFDKLSDNPPKNHDINVLSTKKIVTIKSEPIDEILNGPTENGNGYNEIDLDTEFEAVTDSDSQSSDTGSGPVLLRRIKKEIVDGPIDLPVSTVVVGKSKFHCSLCSYVSASRMDVVNHMSTIHSEHYRARTIPSKVLKTLLFICQEKNGKNKYLCPYCETSGAHSEFAMKQHVRKHVIRTTSRCPTCGYNATSNLGLMTHKKAVHSPSNQLNASKIPTANPRQRLQSCSVIRKANSSAVESIKQCKHCIYSSHDLFAFSVHELENHFTSRFLKVELKPLHQYMLDDLATQGFVTFQSGQLGQVRKTSDQLMPPPPPKRSKDSQDSSTTNSSLSCNLCPYIAKDKHSADKHFKHHRKKYKYPCTVCSYSTDLKELLDFKHIPLHKKSSSINKQQTIVNVVSGNSNKSQARKSDTKAVSATRRLFEICAEEERISKQKTKYASSQSSDSDTVDETLCNEKELLTVMSEGISFAELEADADAADEKKSSPSEIRLHGLSSHDALLSWKQSVAGRTGQNANDHDIPLTSLADGFKLPPAEQMYLNRGDSLICLHCPFIGDSTSLLIAHFKHHIAKLDYSCQFCSYSTDDQNFLHTTHKDLHFPPKCDSSRQNVSKGLFSGLSFLRETSQSHSLNLTQSLLSQPVENTNTCTLDSLSANQKESFTCPLCDRSVPVNSFLEHELTHYDALLLRKLSYDSKSTQ